MNFTVCYTLINVIPIKNEPDCSSLISDIILSIYSLASFLQLFNEKSSKKMFGSLMLIIFSSVTTNYLVTNGKLSFEKKN